MAFPPSATHQYEATVIDGSLEKLWDLMKGFKLEVLNPARITSTEFTDGGAGTVGSHVRVHFQDGSVWVYHVLEVSDIYHKLVFELVSAEPELSYHGCLNTVRLFRDTIQNKTFWVWESDFTNDAGLDVIQDSKYKKQETFASANRVLTQE